MMVLVATRHHRSTGCSGRGDTCSTTTTDLLTITVSVIIRCREKSERKRERESKSNITLNPFGNDSDRTTEMINIFSLAFSRAQFISTHTPIDVQWGETAHARARVGRKRTTKGQLFSGAFIPRFKAIERVSVRMSNLPTRETRRRGRVWYDLFFVGVVLRSTSQWTKKNRRT